MKVKKESPQVYELYGLRIHSELVLPAPLPHDPLPPYDVEVRSSESRTVPTDPNSARLLAKLDRGNEPVYTLTESGVGYTLSFPQYCDFYMSYDLRKVGVYPLSDTTPEIVGVLLGGNVMACILTLAGECLLHASAVEIEGRALAFVGSMGMGKSTLAAAFCTLGAQFVTDDVLRLKPDGKTFYCFPGTRGIRLRKGASALAERFPETLRGETADGRIELILSKNPSRPPLHAIVIPRPSPDYQVLRLERLPGGKAVPYLMSNVKMQGWQQREYIQHWLDFSARLAASIPVFEAEIPWGIPLLEGVALSLAKGVGVQWPMKGGARK